MLEHSEESKKGTSYLINIIPPWKSGLNYAKVKFNPIEIKLFNRDNWKFIVILPILQKFRYVNSYSFEDDLREIIKIVDEREKYTKQKLNKYLRKFDI